MNFSTVDSGKAGISMESVNSVMGILFRDERCVFSGVESVRDTLQTFGLYDQSMFEKSFGKLFVINPGFTPESAMTYIRVFMFYICRLFRCRHVDSNMYFELQRSVKELLPEVFSDDVAVVRSRFDSEIDAIILGQIDLSISSENMGRYRTLSDSAMSFEDDDISNQSLFTASAALRGKWSSTGSLPVDWRVTMLGVANLEDRNPGVQSRHIACMSEADGIRAHVVRDSQALSREMDDLSKTAEDGGEEFLLVDIRDRKADINRRVASSRSVWLERYGALLVKYGLTVPPSVLYVPIVIGTGGVSGSVDLKKIAYEIYFDLYNKRDWTGDSIIDIEDQYRHNDQFRKICLKSLGGRRGFFKTVMYAVTHSSNSLEVAFGLQMLADYCDRERDTTFLGAVLCEFAPIPSRLGQQILFMFLYLIKDRREEYGEVISRCVGILFMQSPRAVKISHTGVDFDENLLPWLKFFDPEELDKIKGKYFRAENGQRKVAESLRGVNPPNGFDKSALLGAIDEHRSVPLCETVEIDCSPVVPAHIHVFLHPVASVSEAETDRSRWRATIVVFQQNGSRSTYSIVNGSLRGGSFKGSVTDPTVNATCEWIAVYAANKYYVRRAEEIARDAVQRTVERVDGGGDSAVDHSAVQKVAGRVAGGTLQVDIRQRPLDRAVVEREGRNRARIDGNLADIDALMRGEEVDLERILLFRRVPGPQKGRDFYERVPVDDVRSIIRAGGLRGKDLYVMTRLPYPTPAGFYEKRVGDTFFRPIGLNEVLKGDIVYYEEVGDDFVLYRKERLRALAPRKPTDHSAYAYGSVYLANGFEPLGGQELEPYDASLSVRADAVYREGFVGIRQIDNGYDPDDLGFSYEAAEKIVVYGSDVEEVRDLDRVSAVELDTNARILMAMRSEWLSGWLDKQEQDIRQDMEDVRNSGLSVEEESRLLLEMGEKIRKLRQEQTEAANLSCIMIGSDGVSGRFALPGRFLSNRLFNQGTFKRLEEVFPESMPTS